MAFLIVIFGSMHSLKESNVLSLSRMTDVTKFDNENVFPAGFAIQTKWLKLWHFLFCSFSVSLSVSLFQFASYASFFDQPLVLLLSYLKFDNVYCGEDKINGRKQLKTAVVSYVSLRRNSRSSALIYIVFMFPARRFLVNFISGTSLNSLFNLSENLTKHVILFKKNHKGPPSCFNWLR